MDLGIAGRTALVLGGTNGIGWAIARALAAEGVEVLLAGRDAALVESRVGELGQPGAAAPGTRVRGVVADLTDAGAVDALVEAAEQDGGHVDILVLNGGGPAPGQARDLTGGAAGDAVALLVAPHVELVHRLLPAMQAQSWGRIIAVGSSGISQPLPNLVASNLGRSALAAYLKTLAGEIAGDGVTVNMVLPGRIQTGRVDALDEGVATREGISVEEARSRAMSTIPAGRYGTTEEFGAVAAFLAGEPAGYVTGVEIRVDGGLVRSR